MRVLHVCSDFAKRRLYSELVESLEHNGVSKQFVYVPVRSDEEIDRNRNKSLPNTRYRITRILGKHHRLLFRRKIATVFSDLDANVEVARFSVTHAHFLFSDGAVALRLRERYGLPYIVAVRNTDLNFFMKFRPDLKFIGRKIIRNSTALVFLSPAYLVKLLAHLPAREHEEIRRKSRIIPNGLSTTWLERKQEKPESDSPTLRLLFVGVFARNKNVPNTIRAAGLLARGRDVRLTLVGGGSNGADEVAEMLASGRHPYVDIVGRIDSQEELRVLYRRHDIFVMPSFLETFGVVYVEALSQGLPVVHSVGQGVDGYFEEATVAAAANPRDPQDIAEKIELLARRLPGVRQLCRDQARRFDWSLVAQSYMELYKEATVPGGRPDVG